MGRREWLEERRGVIGASDGPMILGASKWGSALDVFVSKTTPVEEKPLTPQQDWGIRLEAAVARKYADNHPEQEVTYHENGEAPITRSPDHTWIGCTLDGIILDKEKGRGVLEIKTASDPYAWEDGPPLPYLIQVQHQMYCAMAEWGVIAVLINGSDYREYEVLRHEAFVETVMLPRYHEFWDCVLANAPPPPSIGICSKHALERLYPTHGAPVVELPGEFIDMDDERQALVLEIKRQEARVADIDGLIRAAIRDANGGVLANGVKYTIKHIERDGYTVGPSAYSQLVRKAK